MTLGRKTASVSASKKKKRGSSISRKRKNYAKMVRVRRAIYRFFINIRKLLFSKRMIAFIGSILCTFALFGIIALIYFATLLPDISGLAAAKEQPGVEIFSEDGNVLARYGQITGKYITYRYLPKHLIDAVIATEDRRFFSHFGVDPKGIARAMVTNLQRGRLVQGGSTITQQLAKNVFLTPERTLSRKVQELMMAMWLEQTFSKEEIITIYLNRVYMGGGSYGVDAASRYYFDKSVSELDLVESAMIAGLLKAPSRYNPTASSELAIKRTKQVLLNMVAAGKIQQEQADQAMTELQSGKYHLRTKRYDSERYFADWIVEELQEYIGTVKEDIVVTTTLDSRWQALAQSSVDDYMGEDVMTDLKLSQVAMLAMRPDGAVVSMIGGRDYNKSQYNRAIQARRQPGSAFKLFVYLAAMERGYMPDMFFMDEPIQVGKWRPKNYGNRYRGDVTLTQSLAHSSNAIAVKLSQLVGMPTIRNAARRLGVKSDITDVPSMALGTMEVSLTEMVTAYAHLANNGRAVKPYGIIEIRRKRDDQILYARSDRDDFSNVTVINASNVAKMNTMLSEVIYSGTAKGAQIGRPAAGKTGTTSGYRDAWFIGYTPHLVAGVWVGNDDATSTKNVTGGSVPARIWRSYMKSALKNVTATALPTYFSVYDNQRLPWQRDEEDRPTSQREPAGYKLERSFWDKLFDSDKIEYEYPQ